ncbi:hypothetical protein ACP70R_024130 [Stipagrostis hirtigluma subsp. patula]
MKAFYQAPLVGCTLPSSRRPQRLFLSSSLYYHYSHQYHLVASKDSYIYNKKHKSLMVTLSSFSGMSSEKFPEAGWDICSSSSKSLKNLEDVEQDVLAHDFTWDTSVDTSDMDARFIESIVFDRRLYKYEILDRKTRAAKIMKQQVLNAVGDKDELGCALDTIEQDIVQGKFEWRDGQDVHTNIMEALVNMVGEQAKELTTTNKSDRCLFIVKRWCKDCIEHITTRIKRIQVALVLLAIRNEGLVLSGISKPEDNTLLDDIILPIVKKLDDAVNDLLKHQDLMTFSRNFVCPVTDAYSERTQIGFIGATINYDIPEYLAHMVKTFVSWSILPNFTLNDEVVTYDTFLEKFSNKRTGGLLALDEFLNISSFRAIERFDIEDAMFYLFSSVENVLETLDFCIKFAEGISFNQEKVPISPPGDFSDAISFVQFLKSKVRTFFGHFICLGWFMPKEAVPTWGAYTAGATENWFSLRFIARYPSGSQPTSGKTNRLHQFHQSGFIGKVVLVW